MLPNFKKSESEMPKSPPPFAAGGSRPAPLQPRAERNAPSVIAADLLISGNLVSKGEVQIDGEVQGDISGTHVVVGERARITGSIVADEVVVRGHVMGSIRGRRVMLQSSCHVEGDVYHQALAIEQGAFFEGKSRRSNDPLATEAPRAETAPAPMVAPFPAG
ncbi:MAG: polymer-forming cytoskeletal protein [Hyphomicrobium sp.]